MQSDPEISGPRHKRVNDVLVTCMFPFRIITVVTVPKRFTDVLENPLLSCTKGSRFKDVLKMFW